MLVNHDSHCTQTNRNGKRFKAFFKGVSQFSYNTFWQNTPCISFRICLCCLTPLMFQQFAFIFHIGPISWAWSRHVYTQLLNKLKRKQLINSLHIFYDCYWKDVIHYAGNIPLNISKLYLVSGQWYALVSWNFEAGSLLSAKNLHLVPKRCKMWEVQVVFLFKQMIDHRSMYST